MIATPIPQEQRLRLSCIPWDTYVLYSDGLGPRHIRVTYDQGEMEVTTLSSRHENDKKRLGRLFETLTEVLENDIASFGSMTFRNVELLRGLEADDCYWIENEAAVRGRKDLDLNIDPPPDVAFEVEMSRSTLNRMSIYAALRIPEVWRWDGESLTIHVLTARGTYRVSKRSKAFPFLPLDEFRAFLLRTEVSETRLIREFRAWVRANREEWLG